MKKCILAILAVGVLVGLDQWTKYLAIVNLADGPLVIWDGVFALHYSTNAGAAFGLFQNQRWVFLALTSLVLIAVVVFFYKISSKDKYRPLQILCVFIMAGAIGNMIDRVLNGYVVDFLYFSLIDFPIFNMADCYVTISGIMVIILLFFKYKDEDFKEMLQ